MSNSALKRRILIVGEGRETEYNYFVGFRNSLRKELEATSTSVRVARGKGGNARNIVNHAIKEKRKFEPNRKRGDRVFLLLDSEGTGRASELPGAEELAKEERIEIVYSCPAFEHWLLCHFNKISRRNFEDCAAVIADLNKNWTNVCRTQYDKSDPDIFHRLRSLLDAARAQALKIDRHHQRSTGVARRKNPSTQVYELIAILIGTRTGEECPITGTWKLIDDATVTVELNKGDRIPDVKGKETHWKFHI